MKKKIAIGLSILLTVTGLAFAENNVCEYFYFPPQNGQGGISVFVDSVYTTTDRGGRTYANTVRIRSSGNKMTVQECTRKNPGGKTIHIDELEDVVLEPYEERKASFNTAAPLSKNDIYVRAEGCN